MNCPSQHGPPPQAQPGPWHAVPRALHTPDPCLCNCGASSSEFGLGAGKENPLEISPVLPNDLVAVQTNSDIDTVVDAAWSASHFSGTGTGDVSVRRPCPGECCGRGIRELSLPRLLPETACCGTIGRRSATGTVGTTGSAELRTFAHPGCVGEQSE